jgi:hypothetical protein
MFCEEGNRTKRAAESKSFVGFDSGKSTRMVDLAMTAAWK